MIAVTGGASGIGSAIADRLLDEGQQVLVLDRAPVAPRSGLTSTQVDVTDEEAMKRAVSDACDGSQLQSLICSAGIFSNDALPSSDAFRRLLDVNLIGTWNAMLASEPWLGTGAAVVTLASVSGRTRSATASPAYVASKAGVIGLTKAMAARWAPRGIRVNCVAPGPVDTDMTAGYSETERAAMISQIPLGRFGLAQEIASTVLFLASPASGFITGAVVDANGGMFMP